MSRSSSFSIGNSGSAKKTSSTTTRSAFAVVGKKSFRGRQKQQQQRAVSLKVRASTDEDAVRDTVIVGGGVSGLSTAFTMKSKNSSCDIIVTEIRDRVGGNVTSKNDGQYIWEEGPNSYQPGDAVLKLACDAGMKDDIVLANPDSDRYVLWDGELRALPKDIPTAVLGDFFDLAGEDSRRFRRGWYSHAERGR